MTTVLFVDQTAQLGGAELCLKDLVLRRGGGDRVVLFQDGPFGELLRQSGVDVVVCPLGGRAATLRKASGLVQKVSAAGGMLGLVRKVAAQSRAFDVIYANTPKALVVCAMAGRIARRPVIYHLHDILSPAHFSRSNLRLLVTLANRLTSHVIANSQATADAFVAAGGKPDKLSVIYNGFDVASFDDQGDELELDRCELLAVVEDRLKPRHQLEDRRERLAPLEAPKTASLATDDSQLASPIVAVFGRLAPWKGQHIAIAATAILPDVHLLLVGDALFGEDEYVEELHRLVRDSGLDDRVHFLGFRDDIGRLMRTADVVVHCSTAPEPFGRVIVEAMLARRPVIASAAGGAAEIIRDQQTGLLTPMSDAPALAQAIRRLLTDPGFAAEIADEGYSDACARFRIEDRVAETNAVIESVIGRQSKRI